MKRIVSRTIGRKGQAIARGLATACFLLIAANAYSLNIIPAFDATITSDPNAATIEATINSATALYNSTFSDPVTIYFTFYEMTNGLGQNAPRRETFSYASYRAALATHITSADDATAVAHLPAGPANPVNGNANVIVALPLARALGLTATTGSPDDAIGLNTSVCNLSPSETNQTRFSLFAVVCHEMDEGLGIISALDGLTNGAPAPIGPVCAEDLFRYDETGARSFNTTLSALAFFSLDGSADLARFNQWEAGDYNDWISGINPPQVQDAVGTPGAAPTPNVELRVLDALGYTRYPTPIWVQYGLADPGIGTYARPFNSLLTGTNAVSSGGTILFKYPGSTPEKPRIARPMTIGAVGGPARIGQ